MRYITYHQAPSTQGKENIHYVSPYSQDTNESLRFHFSELAYHIFLNRLKCGASIREGNQFGGAVNEGAVSVDHGSSDTTLTKLHMQGNESGHQQQKKSKS